MLEFFQETLPLGVEISCSRDGRWRLSRSCCHRGMIPESDGLVNRCSRISLGRSVVDMDAMELMKVSHLLLLLLYNLHLRRVSLFGQTSAVSYGGLVRTENQGAAGAL